MKKTLFFASALLLFSIGNAQIANGRIGNGNINIAGKEWTNVYGIDFNNDGVLEFRLSDFSGATGTQTNAYISYNWTENGNNIVADPDMWDYVAILTSGTIIDANSNFAGYGDATFQDLTTAPERIFVGFRISLADGIHFGWAEAVVETSGNDINLNWVACAYNTTPNAPIVAGTAVGIANVGQPGFRVYALGGNQLRIETDNDDVVIYDINGRILNTIRCNGTVTINMPKSGLYLVQVGKTTRKVFVF